MSLTPNQIRAALWAAIAVVSWLLLSLLALLTLILKGRLESVASNESHVD